MSQQPIFSPQSILSGAVCTFVFTITSEDAQRPSDELYSHYKEQQQRLVSEVEGKVKQVLGGEFRVQEFRINRGSVEIILVIGTTYYVISKYKNFIESIDMLFSQLQNLFRRFAPQHAPGPSTAAAPSRAPAPTSTSRGNAQGGSGSCPGRAPAPEPSGSTRS